MSTALIGFDGSEGARRAVQAAKAVLAADRALVVCVWEPGLPMLMDPGLGGVSPTGPVMDPETEQILEDALESSAERAAAEGVALAKQVGFTDVTSLVEPEGGDVARALIRLADEHGADVIVVGSHGHQGVLSRMLGTTSTTCVRHAACPVLVVPPAG